MLSFAVGMSSTVVVGLRRPCACCLQHRPGGPANRNDRAALSHPTHTTTPVGATRAPLSAGPFAPVQRPTTADRPLTAEHPDRLARRGSVEQTVTRPAHAT